jgi:hypothetical protein
MSDTRFTYPPLVQHDATHRGAVVVVISFIFMFVTLLFTILRAWSSKMQGRALQSDDITFYLAAASSPDSGITMAHC